ncbi:sugar phosphate isomerase/epimerase family protein [Paenibacillus sp. strain BS8-2]
MKLGLSSYTLTWSIGVPNYDKPLHPLSGIGLIERAAKEGLGLVQIADNIPLHQCTIEDRAAMKARADQLNIALEIGTRGTEPTHMVEYLEIAMQLDSPIVRTIITTPDMEQAYQDLREVLPNYERNNITIAVENHGMHTTSELIQLFQRLNSQHIGCCLDTVNSFSALESPDTVIEKLMPYLVNLHIKDFDVKRVDHQMGFVVLGTAAGHGRLDIPSLKVKAQTSNSHATAILELWTPFTQSVEQTIELEEQWLNDSMHYFRSIAFQS